MDALMIGRQPLPVHQAIEGDDFMPAGWCGGCEACWAYGSAGIVCEACSYTAEGQPRSPIPWPCPVVCRHALLRERFYAAARAGTRETLLAVASDLLHEVDWVSDRTEFKPRRPGRMPRPYSRVR